MKRVNRFYNIVITGYFVIVLLAILNLVFKITDVPFEVSSALAICCSICGISFVIDKIDYNKKLK